MNNNKGNTNDTDKTGDIISWIITLILLFVFPPAGVIMLLAKLGVFSSRKSKGNPAKVKRSKLDKKTGKGISTFLLLISIALFVTSVPMLISAFSGLASGGLLSFTELGLGIFYLIGGLVSFFSRNIVPRRFNRYRNYYAYIGGRGIIPISDMAQVAGVSTSVVRRDIWAMISSGYLDTSAYIDNELDCLVISAEDAEKLRTEIKGVQDTPIASMRTDDVPESQYAASLAELREVRSFINDENISQKVQRLEDLTEKIFKIAEESPEKQPQLRRFMSYYLPTTLKLVRSYATLEKQGVKGENIMSTKKSIGDILDTLTTGFEQQLDQLFKSDAIDIASDISVLENLMQQDGLTSDKSEFQVSQSGTF